MSVLVAAERVTYAVGGKALVDDVTFAAESGRLVVILGPNGAGKSTLIRLLAGEIRPSAGTVRYGEEPVAGIPGWRLACLRAVLPQASRLAFPFTVREVVRIGLDGIGRGIGSRQKAALLAEAMERADVAHLAARGYQGLSGGERQRVQLARVLAQLAAGRTVAPRQVLLLDEPVASLDLQHQLAVLEVASGLAHEGAAVVAVLHDLNLAAAYADEIVAMADGRVAASGPPAETIDDRLVSEVFGVTLAVGAVPAAPQPFLIPTRSGRPSG